MYKQIILGMAVLNNSQTRAVGLKDDTWKYKMHLYIMCRQNGARNEWTEAQVWFNTNIVYYIIVAMKWHYSFLPTSNT